MSGLSAPQQFWMLLIEQFVVLAGFVSWPVAFFASVYVLRKGIFRVFDRLNTLRYGEAEATFGEEVDQVSEEARKLSASTELLTAEPSVVEDTPPKADRRGAVVLDPSLMVLNSWKNVEFSLVALGEEVLGKGGRVTPSSRTLWELAGKGVIDGDLMATAMSLLKLRNRAVHEENPEISLAAASEYADVAAIVVKALNSALAAWKKANR